MKKSDFYYLENNYIHFTRSNESYPINDFKTVTLRIKPVLKNTWNTLLNATANAMTSSIGNGNEQLQIILDVIFEEGTEEIIMNEKLLVRGNLDFYEMMKHAKNLKRVLKEDLITK